MKPIRTVNFKHNGESFRLKIWEIPGSPALGPYRFTFSHGPVVLFDYDSFYPGASSTYPWSDTFIVSLMGWVCSTKEDDPDGHEDYTPEQHGFAEWHAKGIADEVRRRFGPKDPDVE